MIQLSNAVYISFRKIYYSIKTLNQMFICYVRSNNSNFIMLLITLINSECKQTLNSNKLMRAYFNKLINN